MTDISKRYRIYVRKKRIRLFTGGGGCRKCKKCLAISNNPCKHPNESYFAPESWGVDVYKTIKNLGIEFSVIPYMNLICVGLIPIKTKR